MKNYDRIKTCVDAVQLSDSEKVSLLNVFAEVDNASLEDIAKLFEKDSTWVLKFNDHRNLKHKAAASNDPSLWEEILEQEKKYLADLTYGLD